MNTHTTAWDTNSSVPSGLDGQQAKVLRNQESAKAVRLVSEPTAPDDVSTSAVDHMLASERDITENPEEYSVPQSFPNIRTGARKSKQPDEEKGQVSEHAAQLPDKMCIHDSALRFMEKELNIELVPDLQQFANHEKIGGLSNIVINCDILRDLLFSASDDEQLKHMDPLTTFRLYQLYLRHLHAKQESTADFEPLRKVLVLKALCSDEPMLANAFANYFAQEDPLWPIVNQDPLWTNYFGIPDDMNFVLALLASTSSMICACQYALQIGSTGYSFKQWTSASQERICPMVLVKDALLRLLNLQLSATAESRRLFNSHVMRFSRNVVAGLKALKDVRDIFRKIAFLATDLTCCILSSDISAESYTNAIDTCFKDYRFSDTEATVLKKVLQQNFNPDRRTWITDNHMKASLSAAQCSSRESDLDVSARRHTLPNLDANLPVRAPLTAGTRRRSSTEPQVLDAYDALNQSAFEPEPL